MKVKFFALNLLEYLFVCLSIALWLAREVEKLLISFLQNMWIFLQEFFQNSSA